MEGKESESDSEEENNKMIKLEQEIQQIKEKKLKRELRKKATPQIEGNDMLLKKADENRNSFSCRIDSLRTYEKLGGTIDQGREFEQIMCAFYALKLTKTHEIEDFEMTTNEECYGLFNDIVLKVTFRDKNVRRFLFQLKHKEAAKAIKQKDLGTGKRDFDMEKYFAGISSNSKIAEDDVCILYTNSLIHVKDSTQIEKNINLTRCEHAKYEDLLSNKELQKTRSVFQVTKKLDDKNYEFYFFTEQGDLKQTESHVETMLYNLLRCNIYDSFIHFMTEWWAKNFVLRKDDVIAKLTDLALSPYIKTLNGNKENKKTNYLKTAIMNFQITIVKKTDEEIIENIWPNDRNTDDEFDIVKQKFGLKSNEEKKICWYLNKVPLIVRVKDSNRFIIKVIIELMNQATDNKKIILLGNVLSSNFKGMEVFQNLSDLINKCGNKKHCLNILRTFEISLQGRDSISLERLINIDKDIAKHIGLDELLTMSQTKYITENKKEDVCNLHIPRNVSSIFVKTKEILNIYNLQRNQTVIIINCDTTFKDKLSTYRKTNFEISDYLATDHNKDKDNILFSTKSRCTHNEFTRVCQKSKKTNVYLFQTFDDEFCVLLLRKGNKLPDEYVDKSKSVIESDTLKHFDGAFNVICAPPGMGKSTLMKVLYNNCPSDYWGIYVELINCNSFFAEHSNFDEICNYFLGVETPNEKKIKKQIRDILNRNKKIYLFLDGLDEVDSSYVNYVLDFVKEASSKGINVWISFRENLRHNVTETFNAVPIKIQDLNQKQQTEYVHKKLKEKYQSQEIDKILRTIFDSSDLNKSQRLLGIPLQLHIITEMFLHSKELYKSIEDENMFILTHMYKLFFDGKVEAAFGKVISKEQSHQLGYIKPLKPYELVAVKVCLDTTDFDNLGVDVVPLKEMNDFIEHIKVNGDKYGIIKKINENGEAIFVHQTYAEYFACIWLKTYKQKTALLLANIFSEKYENLRLMFDVMLSENSPLHLSIIYKNVDKFQKNIKKVDIKDEGSRTPLHLMCMYGMRYPAKISPRNTREEDWYIQMMELLTQNNVCINDKDDIFNLDCVNYCLEAKCLYAIEIFLKKKLITFNEIKEKIFNYYESTTLAYYAAQLGYANLFFVLIVENAQLVLAKINGEYLFETAVKGIPDDKISPPREGNIAIVNAILSKGFNINKNVSHIGILDVACKTGKYDMLKILTENGVKCIEGNTIWHGLAQSQPKSEEELKLLEDITIDDDISRKNNGRITALHIGSVTGNYRIVKFILEKGANPNIKDESKNNPLHYASWNRDSWRNNRDKIKLLIERGIDVNAQNINGCTALHLACENGDYEITKILLEHDALINILDKDKNNALHYASASWEDNKNIIKLLIEKGIDVKTQNNRGLTALQVACEHDDCEIRDMILKRLK